MWLAVSGLQSIYIKGLTLIYPGVQCHCKQDMREEPSSIICIGYPTMDALVSFWLNS